MSMPSFLFSSSSFPSSSSDELIPLTVYNWTQWRMQMSRVLRGMGLWEHATGEELKPILSNPASDASRKALSQWRKDESKAIAALLHTCEPGIRSEMQIYARVGSSRTDTDVTAATLWKHMTDKYGKPSVAHVAGITYGMVLRRCTPGEDPVQFASWLQTENNKLEGSKYQYDTGRLAMHLLMSLPDHLDPLRQSFLLKSEDDLKFNDVHAALTTHGHSTRTKGVLDRGVLDTPTPAAAVMATTAIDTQPARQYRCSLHRTDSHSDAECFRQQKDGQISGSGGGRGSGRGSSGGGRGRGKAPTPGASANSCTAYRAQQRHDDEDVDDYLCYISSVQAEPSDALATTTLLSSPPLASTSDGRTVWMVDSGATHHFCSSRDGMTAFRTRTDSVRLGNDQRLAIAGSGHIRVLVHQEGSADRSFTFQNVRYVPGLTVNLLSASCMADHELTTTFGRERAVIRDGRGTTVAVARRDWTGQYTLTTSPVTHPSANATATSKSIAPTLWHRRLAHLGAANTLKLFRRGMVTGTDCDAVAASLGSGTATHRALTCDSCIAGKSHRSPFHTSHSRATAPLQLVHTDLSGPIHGLYSHVIVDDATRILWLRVHTDKTSDTVLSALRHYRAWAEGKQHIAGPHRLLAIRSDNGGEFQSTTARLWYAEHGIESQTTAAHSSASNGVAERMHRTLMDRTRAVLHASGMTERFWTLALQYVAYTTNRSPTAALDNQTPYEAWTGAKPDISGLRPFGCVVLRHVLAAERASTKLSDRGRRCAMVGYTHDRGAYRLWDPIRRQVVVSRDIVEFREDERWADEPSTGRGGPLSVSIPSPPAMTDTTSTSRTDSPSSAPDIDSKDNSDSEDAGDGDESELPVPAHSIPSMQPAPAQPVQVPRQLRDHNPSAGARDVPSAILGSRLRPRNSWAQQSSANYAVQATSARAKALEQYGASRQSEIDAHMKAGTWTITPLPPGANVVGHRFVDTMKLLPDGTYKPKSRLVARGDHQRPGVDFTDTYSPTVRLDALRGISALAAHHDWEFHHMDVKAAYLNGELRELVYMSQPAGFEVVGKEHMVCRLNKAIYGLKQAGRAWNHTIDPALKGIGLDSLTSERCVYLLQSSRHIIILALYVDDLFLFSNSVDELRNYKKKLHSLFEMTDLGEARLVLGMTVTRNRAQRSISFSQQRYVTEMLQRFGGADLNSATTPMEAGLQLVSCPVEEQPTQTEITYYQSAVGALMHAACATRPDISYAVSALSQYSARPSTAHFDALKRVFRYLHGSADQALTYTGTTDTTPRVTAYVDSDYASNPENRRSVTGYAFVLCGGLISWASRRQKTVAQSSVEAEYMAMAEGVKEAIWWRTFLGELSQRSDTPTPIHADNMGAIALARNPEHHARTKHIDVKFHLTRQEVESGTVSLHHVPTQDNTADIFTKPLPKPAHLRHRSALGLTTSA